MQDYEAIFETLIERIIRALMELFSGPVKSLIDSSVKDASRQFSLTWWDGVRTGVLGLLVVFFLVRELRGRTQ